MTKRKDYTEQYKTPKWQKKRLEIMARDEFKCFICGREKNMLSVHHGYYRKGADVWDYENHNLVTLCQDCHEAYHNHEVYSLMKNPFYMIWMAGEKGFGRESSIYIPYFEKCPFVVYEQGIIYEDDGDVSSCQYDGYDIMVSAMIQKIPFENYEEYKLSCLASCSLLSFDEYYEEKSNITEFMRAAK